MHGTAAAILVLGVAAAAGFDAQTGTRTPPKPVPAQVSATEARRLTILTLEDRRDLTPAELGVLTQFARGSGESEDADSAARELQRLALRALGRLERRDLIPVLRGALGDAVLRPTAELGLLLTLRAHARPQPDSQLEEAVDFLISLPASPVILGQLPYSRPDQFAAAEQRLRALLDDPHGPRPAAARGLESLARRNRRLGALGEETLELLERGATWTLPLMIKPDHQPLAFYSMAALLAAGVMNAELVGAAFRQDDPEVRLLGAQALGGSSAIDPGRRHELIRVALDDRSLSVRYEGLRAWIRHESAAYGCGPLVDALSDDSLHLVLAAIDALADRCLEDDGITTRLLSELRMPSAGASWHREAHALVAIARRAPDRAATAIPSFMRHVTWQVRMYAARAAAAIKDAGSLAILAYDADDNVRHAALPPLRALKGAESDRAFLAALGRDDPQLLRTIAILLKGAPANKYLLDACIAAFERLTAQRKETSRDTRLALLERIAEQAGPEQAVFFERLLTDYDAKIAAEAAVILQRLKGDSRAPSPRPLTRPAPPAQEELRERVVARVELDTGRFFEIHFDKGGAPLAYARFVRLVRKHYYDGLTFHRVEPNFVVQGGSPGANEYSGDALFMRDEISMRSHRRGTVGTSTRGRDTGDAQMFINLADNRRLDFAYTAFGFVPESQMEIVDTIQEGTRISRIRMLPPILEPAGARR